MNTEKEEDCTEISRMAELIATYFGHLWVDCIQRGDDGLVDVEATRQKAEEVSAKAPVASAHTSPTNIDGTATKRYSWRIGRESANLSINRSIDSCCRDEVPFAWACLSGLPGYTSIPVVDAEFSAGPNCCCWEDMDVVVSGSPLAHTRHWQALLEFFYALDTGVDSEWMSTVLRAWAPDAGTVQHLQAEREARRLANNGVLGPEDEWEGKVLARFSQDLHTN